VTNSGREEGEERGRRYGFEDGRTLPAVTIAGRGRGAQTNAGSASPTSSNGKRTGGQDSMGTNW